MVNVLILIPPEFNSFSKLQRKLDRILVNLQSPKLTSLTTTRNLGEKYAQLRGCQHDSLAAPLSVEKLALVTHAVVFSDGDVFVEEVKLLRKQGIKTSVQKIKITRVINIRKTPIKREDAKSERYEYIGRGSRWGNPYPVGVEGDDRDEVMRKYIYDFEHDKFLNVKKADFHQLAGHYLGCYCKPDDCHGDIIADYLNAYDDGE